MAKFSRFDPRNKKRDRKKNQSQHGNRDIKIREIDENRANFKINGKYLDYATLDGSDEFQNDD